MKTQEIKTTPENWLDFLKAYFRRIVFFMIIGLAGYAMLNVVILTGKAQADKEVIVYDETEMVLREFENEYWLNFDLYLEEN